ncbi:hypothetical protein Tco_0305325 [Tanacetum coccineum]
MELLCPPLNLPHQRRISQRKAVKVCKQGSLHHKKITKSSSSVSVKEGLQHVNQEKEAKSVALLGLYRAMSMLKKILEGHEEPQFKLDDYIMLYTYPSSLHSIKQCMEKDVDKVGKIAQFIKEKIEELDKEVRLETTSIELVFSTII